MHAGSGTTGLATVQVALEGTVTFGVCVHPCPSYSHGRCRSRPISRWGAAHQRGSKQPGRIVPLSPFASRRASH